MDDKEPVWTQSFILKCLLLFGIGIVALVALIMGQLEVVYGCGTMAFFILMFL